MSTARKMFVGTSSLAGGLAGRVITPPVVAPIARALAHKAMNFMWGPSVGVLSHIARKGIAEHVGHQAFNYAIPAGGVIGGASTALAAQGVWTLGAYALHLQKNRSFLKGVESHGVSEKASIDTFELDEKEGFQLA